METQYWIFGFMQGFQLKKFQQKYNHDLENDVWLGEWYLGVL